PTKGGGPAGGGVPGGVRKNDFASFRVLPGLSFTIPISCTCLPWFEMSTTPRPVKPLGTVKEKSRSVIVDAAEGRVSSEAAVFTTLTTVIMPCATCGLPSEFAGMKQTTAYFPGSSLTVAVVAVPALAMLGPPANTVDFCTAPMSVLI